MKLNSITSLKSILYNKIENSTFGGLSKVVRSERILLKILWSMVLFIFIGLCSFAMIRAVFDYLAYEIVTSITVRTEIPAKMPTIIICNANGLNTATGSFFASQVYSLYGIVVNNNYLNFQINEFPNQINNKGNILTTRTMVMSAARDPQLTDDFRKSLGLSIKDMLVSCTFNSIECSDDNFIWLYDTYYGNCYTFNATGNDQISQSGKFTGLNMELFVGIPDSVEQVAQNGGLHIFIVNETVKVNPFSDSFKVAAGKQTNLLVNKKRIIKIQKPYGECTPDLNKIDSYPTYLYRLTFEIYNTYRQKDCFNSCYQFNLIAKLGCYSASFPYLSNTTLPACLQGMDLYNSLYYFSMFYIEEVSVRCEDCPLECESELYSLTSSSLDYPTQIYAEMLAKQSVILNRFANITPTYDQLKQSMVSVNINYNELGFTQIREKQKITTLDLVTNIGGTIGLFMGLSCLSFFELVEFAIELVHYFG